MVSKFYPLFSSSKGNCEFIGDASGGILIDAGVTFKRITSTLKSFDIDISAVKGVFITHSHSDHVKGLKMLTAKTGIPVFGQYETLCELVEKGMISAQSKVYEMDSGASIAGMEVNCFDTPHDTVRSCGYKITLENGKTCAVCTDLGHITETVDRSILGCDLVMLESNYDPIMLQCGPYPEFLKERIISDRGHLSNKICAQQVKRLIENGTSRVILGHLSQENNTPELAEKTVLKSLDGFKRDSDYILEVAPVESCGEMAVL